MPSLSQKTIGQIGVLWPPEEDQKKLLRIVKELFIKVEALENLTEKRIELQKDYVTSAVNQLSKNDSKAEWQALKPQFHTFFNEVDNIKKLRETILQLAVQGKLTAKWRAQNPELISGENSAENLLKEIKAEKAKLIKDKKIKKEKALPPIKEDEIPYQLPEGWVWCNFGELAEFINGDRGKNYPNKSEYVEEGIAWINTGHIEPEGILSVKRMNYITKEKFDSLRSGKIKSGDLVYCLRGATFGKTSFVDPFSEGAIASSLMIIRAYKQDLNDFIYRFLISPEGRTQLKRFDNGSAQPNLSANKVKLYHFPLPPENEQKVIVDQVNFLMGHCDQLEREIETGQRQIEDLMQSVLKKVFEGEKELETA